MQILHRKRVSLTKNNIFVHKTMFYMGEDLRTYESILGQIKNKSNKKINTIKISKKKTGKSVSGMYLMNPYTFPQIC